MVDLRSSSPKRNLIEGAATKEFAEFGYHGARVDRIARLAGVNKQLIYYYFGSKRSLYEHTLSLAAEGFRTPPAARRQLSGSPAERFRNLLVQTAERAAATPDLVRAAVLSGRQEDGSHKAAIAALAADLAAEVSRGQGLGHFRDDVDPGMVGRQAAILVLGSVAVGAALGGDRDTHTITDWAQAAADLFARALTW